jgi:serine/threonine protein kinase
LHVRKIHDAGFVHQDIKFKNILIYHNGERLSMELCDFGLTREMDQENCLPQATIGFQSPEVSLLYFQSENWNEAEHCYFYVDGMTCNTLGYQYFDQQNLKFNDFKIEREKYKTVHKANDIWALGIVIFALKNFGKMPRSIQDLYSIEDPLIKGLLDPKREKRLTIHQAIEIHQITMTRENPLAVLFKTAKNLTHQEQTIQQNLKTKSTDDSEKTSNPSIRKTII